MNAKTEDVSGAVAAPVEKPVRPRYWMTREAEYRLKNGGNAKGAVPVHARPSVAAKIPLYGQAELDAAVAAERERWRELLEARAAGCERAAENTEDPKFDAMARVLMSVREDGSKA